MEAQFTTLGAIVGLVIAIVLIIKKVQPAYSLILGALIGGLIGGGGLAKLTEGVAFRPGIVRREAVFLRQDLRGGERKN